MPLNIAFILSRDAQQREPKDARRRGRAISLPDAEIAEDDVEEVLDVDPAGDAAQGAGGEAEVFGGELGERRGVVAAECRETFLERGAMARAGDERRAGRVEAVGEFFRHSAQ